MIFGHWSPTIWMLFRSSPDSSYRMTIAGYHDFSINLYMNSEINQRSNVPSLAPISFFLSSKYGLRNLIKRIKSSISGGSLWYLCQQVCRNPTCVTTGTSCNRREGTAAWPRDSSSDKYTYIPKQVTLRYSHSNLALVSRPNHGYR